MTSAENQQRKRNEGLSDTESSVSGSSEATIGSVEVKPHLSSSVERAIKGFSRDELISAWAIVQSLLRIHIEYGHHLAKELADAEGPEGTVRATVTEWLDRLYGLFDQGKVDKLHGRVVILGLGHIDAELGSYLEKTGLAHAIQSELTEPFESLLIKDPHTDTSTAPDATVFYADSPAADDQLGRRGFAEALAVWLSRYWTAARDAPGNSFVLHLYGAWGAGKTSLLNLLKQALQAPGSERHGNDGEGVRWAVVWFNAWQHQHIEPPWWPLLDTVVRQLPEQAEACFEDRAQARRLRMRERLWRLRSAHRTHLIVLCIVSVLIVLGLAWAIRSLGRSRCPLA